MIYNEKCDSGRIIMKYSTSTINVGDFFRGCGNWESLFSFQVVSLRQEHK